MKPFARNQKTRLRALAIAAMLPLFAAVMAIGDDSSPSTQPAWPNADPQVYDHLIDPLNLNHSPPSQDDPIGPLANQMKNIVGDLTAMQTDPSVQIRQRRVVNQLDELIKELEQQRSGSGGAGANPTSPLQKSMIVRGPGGQGPLHDPKAGTRVWGQLPPKAREQIQQSQTEGFPPGYESVLSNYYSRLAQGQLNSDAAANHPTTQP